MRKAIQIEVRLWIEGDDDPAHDWSASTTAAVREIIEKGATSHPELTVTIKRVRELA